MGGEDGLYDLKTFMSDIVVISKVLGSIYKTYIFWRKGVILIN